MPPLISSYSNAAKYTILRWKNEKVSPRAELGQDLLWQPSILSLPHPVAALFNLYLLCRLIVILIMTTLRKPVKELIVTSGEPFFTCKVAHLERRSPKATHPIHSSEVACQLPWKRGFACGGWAWQQILLIQVSCQHLDFSHDKTYLMLLRHCMMTNMSSMPMPRQRKGRMACMGV